MNDDKPMTEDDYVARTGDPTVREMLRRSMEHATREDYPRSRPPLEKPEG